MLLTYKVLSISLYSIPDLSTTKPIVSQYGIECQVQSDSTKVVDYLTGLTRSPVQCSKNTQTWTATKQCSHYPLGISVATSLSHQSISFCDSCDNTRSNMEPVGLQMILIDLMLINLPPRMIILNTSSSTSRIAIDVQLVNSGVVRCAAFTSPYTPLTTDSVLASAVLGSNPVCSYINDY